jgi:hypothetical protein
MQSPTPVQCQFGSVLNAGAVVGNWPLVADHWNCQIHCLRADLGRAFNLHFVPTCDPARDPEPF